MNDRAKSKMQLLQELKRLSDRMTKILVSITDGFIAVNCEGHIEYVNPAAQKILGRSELEGKRIWDALPFNPVFNENIEMATTLQEAVHFEAFSQAAQCWLEAHCYPSKEGFSIYFRDISERKLAESKRQIERQRLYTLLDGLPSLVSLHAPDNTLRFANRYYNEVFGEHGGRPCYEVFLERKEPCEYCPTRLTFEENRPHQWEHEYHGKIFEFHEHPFIDIDGSPLVVKIGIDITERKRAEQEMARLDRLNLVGEMAAGIAHEVRNPMTTVRGFLQMLGAKAEPPDKEYYSLMINELDRANSILTEFLALAKDRTINLKEHKLNQIIQTLYPLMLVDALNADKNIVLETQDVKGILVDEKEIRQLILNLVRNALEAMPSGGTVTLRTVMDDRDVVLAVKDQGSGIKEEIIGQLGKPFLSTKEQGTGLGLAICYSIAARHHAAIDFETGDSGTTFFVRFKENPYAQYEGVTG